MAELPHRSRISLETWNKGLQPKFPRLVTNDYNLIKNVFYWNLLILFHSPHLMYSRRWTT